MITAFVIRLIGGVAIAAGFAAAYMAGRANRVQQEPRRDGGRVDRAIPMEHEHGGGNET